MNMDHANGYKTARVAHAHESGLAAAQARAAEPEAAPGVDYAIQQIRHARQEMTDNLSFLSERLGRVMSSVDGKEQQFASDKDMQGNGPSNHSPLFEELMNEAVNLQSANIYLREIVDRLEL